MNKVKKCSIAGISFTLETDAYETLNAYIDSLRNAYKGNPDGEEIIADIEARIAELILSTISADSIVGKPLIDNIIRQLGSAEEIDDEQSEHSTLNTDTRDQNGNPRIPRRLYRDLSNGKLGGVCAGLSNYFDIDAVWLRLVMLLPLLFSPVFRFTFERNHIVSFSTNLFWFVIIGYIIMWIVIPAASSARQKLEMKGERVTARNISEKAYASAPDEPARTIFANIVALIGRILLILLKIFAALIFIGLIGGATLLGVVAVAAIPIMSLEFTTGLTALAFVLMILIPIIVLIYLTLMLLLSTRPKASVLLVLFVIWIMMIPTLIISALKSPRNFDSTIENLFESVVEKDDKILYQEFTDEEIREWQEKNDINLAQEGVSSTLSDAELLEQISLSEPTKGATTATKSGTESWATNPKVYYYPVNGKVVKGYSHDGVYILFYGSNKNVDVCVSHLAIDKNGYVSTWTKDGNKYLICKYGIKADDKVSSKKKSKTFYKRAIDGQYGEECLIRGEIDDVKVRYFVGDSKSSTVKDEISKLSNTSYIQGLF